MDIQTAILASSLGGNLLTLLAFNKMATGMTNFKHVASDISTLSQVVEINKESEDFIEQLELATLLFNQSADSILVASKDGIITSANPSFFKKTGYTLDDVVGQHISFCSTGIDASFNEAFQSATDGEGVATLEIITEKSDKTSIPELCTISTIYKDNEIKSVVLFARDISEQKERENRLIREAKHDKLTGVYNREGFNSRLTSAIETLDAHKDECAGMEVGIVFLDLDEFKPVNDTYGHDVGDSLLIAVAERLKESIGELDTVARLGGDEFVAIFPMCHGKEDLLEKSKKILYAMREPVHTDAVDLTIKCSIGAASYPSDAQNQEQLIKASDVAMYQAKSAGKNQIRVYDEEFKSQDQEFEELAAQLEEATSEDELDIALRPVYNDAGDVYYFDILLRWFKSDEEVSPHKLVKVAEKHDKMQSLYDFILRKLAFSPKIKKLMSESALFSIKIEEKAIKSDSFSELLLEKLDALGIPKTQIIIRVDEPVVAANYKAAVANINHLETQGVKVCLDDFCTGEFSILSRLAICSTFAKLPRELVNEMIKDPNKAHSLGAIFALAEAMGCVIVIEGIESEDAYRTFGEHGARYLQGDFLSRVLLESELPESIVELQRIL